jgi:23S rRNA-/tRNA-specific pseudouridylate synthase
MDLDIIYEDSEIIILNKDPNTNVHPVPGEGGNS